MKTLMLTDSNEDLQIAADLLRSGELVVFPTETVYGLGANGLSEPAVAKIFAAKGRPSDNPLILHIAALPELQHIVQSIPDSAKVLMKKLWPGPLTLVLNCQDGVPHNVTAGLKTVAVRMPSLDVASRLINLVGVPIAAPSANISGKPSPTCASDVLEDLDGKVAAIISADQINIGLESTVLDCTSVPPKLLRPGGVTVQQIEEAIGTITVDVSIDTIKEVSTPKSPGMKYKHYAPKANVYVLEDQSVAQMATWLADKVDDKSVGLLVSEALAAELQNVRACVKPWRTEQQLARNLYAKLREFDREGVTTIYAQGVPAVGLGLAIMNRMRKSAGFKIIRG